MSRLCVLVTIVSVPGLTCGSQSARGLGATWDSKDVLALRHKAGSAFVGFAALAGAAFGLGRVLRRIPDATAREQAGHDREIVEAVTGSTASRTHLAGDLDSFAAGYQTLVAIIEGVAFGALIVTGQNVIFRSESIAQRLTATGQLITTFTVIAAVTYEYLQLVRSVRWTPKLADTTFPYALGVGQVAMSITIGNNARWWGSTASLSFLSAWAFGYSRMRAKKAAFVGGKKRYKAFVSEVTAFSIASTVLFVLEALMCALAVRHAERTWLFTITPFASFPLYFLIVKVSRNLIRRRQVTQPVASGSFSS